MRGDVLNVSFFTKEEEKHIIKNQLIYRGLDRGPLNCVDPSVYLTVTRRFHTLEFSITFIFITGLKLS